MSVRQEPFAPSKGAALPIDLGDDALLRERAHAPVESAIRSHFANLGSGADDATVRNATGIVLRGLTHSALSRIASAGISGSELIQTLIPKPAQPGTLPAFNWSAITPAEIARLRSMGLLSERQHKAAMGMHNSGADDRGGDGPGKGMSYKNDLPWSEEKLGAYAREKGVPWLANHPDLRRLTPAAIETFARMQFDRESYHALTRDAGLSPEKAHGLVKAMEDAKVTPDQAKELAKKFGATSKGLTPELQKQHHELMENWLRTLKADPGAAPAELGKLHKWLDERKAADPGRATAVEDEKKATIRIQEERAREIRTDANTSAKEQNADVGAQRAAEQAKIAAQNKGQVTSGLDALNTPAQPGQPQLNPPINVTPPAVSPVQQQAAASQPPPKPAAPLAAKP